MTEPAENDPAHDQEDEEVLGVKGKVTEVLDHGKARADQCSVDNAISHVIEFVAQNDEEQEKAKPFDRLLCNAGIESLQGYVQYFAVVRIEESLYDVIDI